MFRINVNIFWIFHAQSMRRTLNAQINNIDELRFCVESKFLHDRPASKITKKVKNISFAGCNVPDSKRKNLNALLFGSFFLGASFTRQKYQSKLPNVS